MISTHKVRTAIAFETSRTYLYTFRSGECRNVVFLVAPYRWPTSPPPECPGRPHYLHSLFFCLSSFLQL